MYYYYAHKALHRVTVGGGAIGGKKNKIKYLGHSSYRPMQLDPYSGLPSQAYYVYIKIGILSPLKMSIQEHSREREEALRWDYVTCHSKALHLIDVNCTRPPQRIEMELHNNLFSLQENA